MNSYMELTTQLQTKLNLNPQLRQSLEILQKTGIELAEYEKLLAAENPFIELDDADAEKEAMEKSEQVLKKLQWLDSVDEHNYRFLPAVKDERDTEIELSKPSWEYDVNLKKYILDQIAAIPLNKKIEKRVRYIVESLDDNGYLPDSSDEIAHALNISIEQVEQAVAIVQSFEPAGVGARDLKECLLLQLKRTGKDAGNAAGIVKNYLEELGKNQLPLIARELKISIEAVKEAASVIRSLNPKPGNSFSPSVNIHYIVPDVIVVRFKNQYEILLNDYFIPKIQISSYYKSILTTTNDKETRKYLAQKFNEAEWAVKSISQRNQTLLNCIREIVSRQQNFFDNPHGQLVPLTLSDIADSIGVHESTVSRAIQGKYLQCMRGTYAISDLFPRKLHANGDTEETPEKVKALILNIIQNEDKKKPLSDRKITEILNSKGSGISRRTVAKYRDALGIQGASGRKQI